MLKGDGKPPFGLRPGFNLMLQPEFAPTALILMSDALRIANQNSGRDLFEWCLISESGEPVRASNGMWFSVDHSFETAPKADVYLLFEGNLPTQLNSPKMLGFIRTAARFGAIVGGIDTGAFALAQAGVATGDSSSDIVLHWEAMQTFCERFPDFNPKDQINLLNARSVFSAGGVAALDLMLDLIAHFYGQALANEVADALVHTRREASTAQRGGRYGGKEQTSVPRRLVSLMEQNLDFPLSLPELADEFGVSQRTLARICMRSFGESPMRLYLHIRLQSARNLLFYEEFSIKDVATACGFSYPAVFSRSFKAQYGQTPREFREKFRAYQNMAVRPEIRRLITPER